MSKTENIFSIRVVVVDYYITRPIIGLDPCYSPFRAHEIKQVPVIRIFGSTATGEKTCMHVHGVFPYFYVPYESSNVGDVDQTVYQMATSLDKAINISLGQGSSKQQHIFKIQLVKGIPFYGYHRKEHQFLKIYIYNPKLIKKAATLCQNGLILGKIFQPHESHVPYVLQFFIDYNLYGMSFLHVPKEIVKYRQNDNKESLSGIDPVQILDEKISRISVSYYEIDIAAAFILNRFQIMASNSENTNPGIESIWQDERIRRETMNDDDDNIPPLEIPITQERPTILPTTSELFYKNALDKKLEQIELLDQTSNTTSSAEDTTLTSVTVEKKSTFNLSKLLSNAIYPGECSQDLNSLTNASTILDHLSNESIFHTSLKQNPSNSPTNNMFDETLLEDEEELILSLTTKNWHNITLQEQDFDLLEVMKNLEEDSGETVDLDSMLAPLSQSQKYIVTPKENPEAKEEPTLNITISANDEEEQFDSDDDCFNYTMIMNDTDEFSRNRELNNGNIKEIIPQVDGMDDLESNQTERTPKKCLTNKINTSSPRSLRSRNSGKYTPLDIIKRRSIKKIENGGISINEKFEDIIVISSDEDDKSNFKRRKMNTKKGCKNLNLNLNHNNINGGQNSENEKTFVTCNLRRKSIKDGQALKVYTPPKTNENKLNKSINNVNHLPNLIQDKNNIVKKTRKLKKSRKFSKKIMKIENLKLIKKCKVKLKKLSNIELKKFRKIDNHKKQRIHCWSPCDIAREYDRRNNFFPEPGPSHINYYQLIEVPNSCITPKNSQKNMKKNNTTPYSPSIFSDGSPSNLSDHHHQQQQQQIKIKNSKKLKIKSIISSNEDSIIITPKQLPPNYDEVRNNFTKFHIPEITYTKPFYSNDNDITNRKEIGHTILRIPGNSLNNLEDFISLLPNIIGINIWRRSILTSLGSENLNQLKTDHNIKEYLSSKKKITTCSRNLPPTYNDAEIWLKSNKKLMNNNNNKTIIDINDDSPIKIRREKIKMILNNTENSDDDHEIIDSYLLTTPTTTSLTPQLNKKSNNSSSNRNDNNIKCKARHSLTETLNNIKVKENNLKIKCVSSMKLRQSERQSDENKNTSQISDDSSTRTNGSFISNMIIKQLSSDDTNSEHDKSFGISAATLDNTYGFKVNLENLQNCKSDMEHNYLTVMSLEVFVQTRDDLKPNPEFDSINCIFFAINNNVPENYVLPKTSKGIIIVSPDCKRIMDIEISQIIYVKNEYDLFIKLLELCKFWDPDILAGYEIEMNSWGYAIDRAKVLDINLTQLLSRIPSQKVRDIVDEDKDQFTDLDVEMKLCGRILLDVWRLLRSEIALTSYTFENVMYHIMHKRCPLHSFRHLSKLFETLQTRWIVFEYFLERVSGTLELLEQLDLIGRTSEMAKLIGIQFYEVLSRGSQFRVESMMLRIAKPKNLVPLSPSIQQRAHMRAPEYLPLILEPQSRLYVDPLIVLDFQSLYPSMIIAYNYCFSTCLGRVEHLGQSVPFEFGASQYRISLKELKNLIEKDLITISPCGVVFVKSSVREGVLPRMLQEILSTRLMVKESMKIHKTNSILQRVLHARQLGLKLIANVTYGYTAANFSGRMPCVEVGDSVVSKGRETLERAIKLVESNEKWNVKVVYGDTDSLFVLAPGRSRKDAFQIGKEIAEAVTNDNPKPVKLKLEKVYQPSLLQTKKRYVGYMYESADQDKPIYEAKGIETVRRDGCPAVGKMLEKCLRILFETCDVSAIKEYVCRQFTKLLSGRANIQDLIFAKEFRGRHGYKPTACVPALELTKKWLQTDPRNEPRRGERVPFLIVNGPPGLPLIRLVRSPYEFLADEGLKINTIYYITKAIIPPLNRCLLLIGADVNDWFADLPRKHLLMPQISNAPEVINVNKKKTISQYFSSTNCVIDCGNHTKNGICSKCIKDQQKCSTILSHKISNLERSYFLTSKICQSCCGRQNDVKCYSLDCPVLFILNNRKREKIEIQNYNNLLEQIM